MVYVVYIQHLSGDEQCVYYEPKMMLEVHQFTKNNVNYTLSNKMLCAKTITVFYHPIFTSITTTSPFFNNSSISSTSLRFEQ